MLYDEDILLWSEQQAHVIRRLGATSFDLPNELDVENVAEEIESVGRSELAAVESFIRLILLHLIKISSEPDALTIRHWKAEIGGFHADLLGRFSPSMRQRIDLGRLWTAARNQALLGSERATELEEALPQSCPIELDQILATPPDIFALLTTLQHSSSNSQA